MPQIKFSSEPRTAQISVKIGQTLKSELEKIAIINRSSITDITNSVLARYAREHIADIERFEEVFERR